MQIAPSGLSSKRHGRPMGLAYVATLIRKARQEAANTLLVDNGDFLSGTAVADVLADCNRPDPEGPDSRHPMIEAMNRLGYDAGTLGNHDFDNGLTYLGSALAQADFPIVSANALQHKAARALDDTTWRPPFTLLTRQVKDTLGRSHTLKIGVIGILPPQSVPQFRTNAHPILTRDIIETAQAWVPEMKDRGVDIVLALAHSGIGADRPSDNMQNAIVPLTRVEGIDAIVAGHSHRVFPDNSENSTSTLRTEPGHINHVPVVNPGFCGSHLGVIDLQLEQQQGRWIVNGSDVEVRATANQPSGPPPNPAVKPDPQITRLYEKHLTHVEEWMQRPVGHTPSSFHSFFALVAPSSAVQLVQNAQTWFVKTRLQPHSRPDTPVLSSACPFKCGGLSGPDYYTHIKPGNLTLQSISDLYAFPNDLALLSITGSGLAEWLERGASVFNRIVPGAPGQSLKAAAAAAYDFESIHGVSYDIDLTQGARYTPEGALCDASARRIRNLTYQGVPVVPGQKFTLVTSSYRLGGGGCFPGTPARTGGSDLSIPIRQVLVDYLSEQGENSHKPEQHWRFAPAEGAQIGFLSAPQAREYLDELDDLSITMGNVDADGFQTFQLTL